MSNTRKINEDGLTGAVGSFDAGDTGLAYKSAASIHGMGAIQYPTRDGQGSGDVPSPPLKKKKKKKMKYLKEIEEYIPGGNSSGKTIEDIAKKHNVSLEQILDQLKKGIEVEKEHTKNPDAAREIAMDHLWEDPKYYDKLYKMEHPDKTAVPVEEEDKLIETPVHLEEDFGSGKEKFETLLSRGEIDSWNEPAEWESLSVKQGKITWEADLEIKKFGIEGISLSVSKIHFIGEIDKGEEYQDWDLTISSDNMEIEIGKNIALIPLYPSAIEIDFNKSSNKKDWKIKVTFGAND
jgi:hypothetical protein